MSVVYVTSDWHLGHTSVAKWRTTTGCLVSAEDHDEYLLDMYKSMVKPRDVVLCLGDMIMSRKYLLRFSELPGKKVLVAGNHDTDRLSDRNTPITMRELANVYQEIHGLTKYKGVWLSHAPLHPDELRGSPNVHGHTHTSSIDDPRYRNVCLEQTEYKLAKWQDIKESLCEVT